jgi:hypothetical protein
LCGWRKESVSKEEKRWEVESGKEAFLIRNPNVPSLWAGSARRSIMDLGILNKFVLAAPIQLKPSGS